MKKIVVLSGAGISAESGLKTFRDANGLWEGHDVMEVASPEGWSKNQELVLDFYNQRRRQLKTVQPNAAHKSLVELEAKYEVDIITQNVDDLHERAGSSAVIHLHGELLKARSTADESIVLDWNTDIITGDRCSKNSQLRPHIVWFGEMVPLLETAAALVSQAHYIIIVGTSMQVYPAAGLIDYAKQDATIYFIDPKPSINSRKNLNVIAEKATIGIPTVVEELMNS
ncbi:SIR2 family NAD-dependent protein deacylase [Leeuwenhoekiella sp. MAR_2009_132]|uniref:SIR2 family NAD-dependent protein deacylase n=1 Tax=Leeuwenhoekiella sp. MAR_2009_132 TaxID=1392489 RepID=UPI00048B8B13|nr:NAD-dependent deacylase [Leeuwenhoekiella sp. MAR_2009_132]